MQSQANEKEAVTLVGQQDVRRKLIAENVLIEKGVRN
jgi:hypothetical protein